MGKNRAVPQGYMTVGELAKKMNTTVRTMQFYDKEGLLSPSAESEGGRRLYTHKDAIRLHQIQSMKYLGFSLDDIKNRLVSLDSPEDVASALSQQAKAIREKIAKLSEVLGAIEKLRAETLQMQTVDFKKYADIVVNLRMKNEFYGLIKHFDDETLDHIRSHIDKESGTAIINTMSRLCGEAAELQQNGTPPESEQGQALAIAWWDMVMKFTGGDMGMLPSLMKFAESKDSWDGDWKEKWSAAEPFLQSALEAYFANLGIDPFEEAASDSHE
jgi:DNA-binding transcriptional MerR regulator